MRNGVVAFCCAVTLASLLVAGCGGSARPKTVAVSGNLTLDGKPVQEARIRFNPSQDGVGRTAIGDTDASGNFKLSTFEPGDGIIPGEYDADVIISKVVSQPLNTPDIAAKVAAEAPTEGEIPTKYGDVKTSGLHYTFTDQDTGRLVEVKMESN